MVSMLTFLVRSLHTDCLDASYLAEALHPFTSDIMFCFVLFYYLLLHCFGPLLTRGSDRGAQEHACLFIRLPNHNVLMIK